METVPAPLSETLAAALLTIAGYRGDEILCDPCCGGGTLLIEAALMAANIPPGFLRSDWGFRYHPDFSQAEWLKVKALADQRAKQWRLAISLAAISIKRPSGSANLICGRRGSFKASTLSLATSASLHRLFRPIL